MRENMPPRQTVIQTNGSVLRALPRMESSKGYPKQGHGIVWTTIHAGVEMESNHWTIIVIMAQWLLSISTKRNSKKCTLEKIEVPV
jgi:hypothetical protein